ncbi:MAG: hypothetical protein ACFFE5_05270 [Candidatus Thorarchaeota archaeon]
MQEKNVLAGVLIIDIIAFICYIIFPSGLLYFGDLQMIIGCIVGTRFTLRNIKPNQSFFVNGILVGLGGSILAGISYTMFDWVYFLGILSASPFTVLMTFEYYFIEAIIIGLLFGVFISYYYNYKHKINVKASAKDEKLLESLVDQ